MADDLQSVDDASTTEEGPNQDNDDQISVSSSSEEDNGTAFPDTQVNLLQPIGGILQGVHETPADEEVIVYSQAVKKKVITVKASNKHNKDKGFVFSHTPILSFFPIIHWENNSPSYKHKK